MPPSPTAPDAPAPYITGGRVVDPGLPVLHSAPLASPALALDSYIDTSFLERIFSALGWSIGAEVRVYVEIAEDTTAAPSVRMAAARALHQLALRGLLLRGDIQSTTVSETHTSRDPDGTRVVKAMAEVVRKTQHQLKESANARVPQLTNDDFGIIPADEASLAESEAAEAAAPFTFDEADTSEAGDTGLEADDSSSAELVEETD